MRLALALLFVALIAAWPAWAAAQQPAPDDHSAHGSQPSPAQQPPPVDQPAPQSPPAPWPPNVRPVTEADRAAAFPDVHAHAMQGDGVHALVLFDQFEWQVGAGLPGFTWDTKGWVGTDRNRLWFRTEGATEGAHIDDAQAHVLYGRAIAPWWDLVAGLRQDVRPGPARTWAAVGVQGLAPYWFDIEATAYIGASARTHVRLETEYELLVTNRLILQPLVEVEIYGKADPERGIGAGLSSADAGLRLRYEFRREFAPYVGVSWHWMFFGTADAARAAGDRTAGARLALGVRWRL